MHFYARNRVVCRNWRQNKCAHLGGTLSQEPLKIAESFCNECAKSRIRKKTMNRSGQMLHNGKYPRPSHIFANSVHDRLRGFVWGEGSNFPFPIDFHLVLL